MIDPNGGQIEGAVRNSKNATVTLIPSGSHHPRLYKITGADPHGYFDIKGIPPGEYMIYAWETLEPGAYLDQDFIKRYESAGKRVTIRSNDHQTLQLRAIPSLG